jgi:hypothetical protein
MPQPGSQPTIDLGVALTRMTTPKVHAHHLDAILVQAQRQAELVGQPFVSGSGLVHAANCTVF